MCVKEHFNWNFIYIWMPPKYGTALSEIKKYENAILCVQQWIQLSRISFNKRKSFAIQTDLLIYHLKLNENFGLRLPTQLLVPRKGKILCIMDLQSEYHHKSITPN